MNREFNNTIYNYFFEDAKMKAFKKTNRLKRDFLKNDQNDGKLEYFEYIFPNNYFRYIKYLEKQIKTTDELKRKSMKEIEAILISMAFHLIYSLTISSL